jgi:hypothetical protein
VKKNCLLKLDWFFYAVPISLITGLLYFVIAIAGAGNLEQLFHFENHSLWYLISGGAAICYGMFTYKFFEFMTLKPSSIISWCLAILAPIAASCFLTAGIEGSSRLNIFNANEIIVIGIILFLMRTLNYIDGAVKFPDRLVEIKTATLQAFYEKNYKSISCILIVFYTAIGYSLSTTDPIYTASIKITGWLGVTASSYQAQMAYIFAAVGALVGLPMVFYWTQRGIIQLTNSGMPDKKGVLRDPTDIYTYIGLIAALPVILGSLGAATGSSAHVFGKLGLFADVVRVSTSVIFALCAGIPGLATLFRGFNYFLAMKQANKSI